MMVLDVIAIADVVDPAVADAVGVISNVGVDIVVGDVVVVVILLHFTNSRPQCHGEDTRGTPHNVRVDPRPRIGGCCV